MGILLTCLVIVGCLVLGAIALVVYLSCSMFRSAGQIDIKEDYLPAELADAQRKLEGAQLNYDVLAELPGTQFVLPDAAAEIEQAQTELAAAVAKNSVSSAGWRAVQQAG